MDALNGTVINVSAVLNITTSIRTVFVVRSNLNADFSTKMSVSAKLAIKDIASITAPVKSLLQDKTLTLAVLSTMATITAFNVQ